MDKCMLCCKREGEKCRTKYFQFLVQKHLTVTIDGDFCICESCGQLLRHWDDFSAEAQANLSRKACEPDSVNDGFSGKSCDQETQTDFEESQSHLLEHSYAKPPSPLSVKSPPSFYDECCQVDSSSLVMFEESGYCENYPPEEYFSDSTDSGIKILEVCALKEEQWFDEPTESSCVDWDPDFKVKDEPLDYDEYEDNQFKEEQHFLTPFQHKFEPSDMEMSPPGLKVEMRPVKDETNDSVPASPLNQDKKVKEEPLAEQKPALPPTPEPPAPPTPSHACPLCGKEFPENDLLVSHLRSHENFFKPALHLCCPDCNQEFQSEHILVEHIMEYHVYNENAQICCVICGQTKSSRVELKKHIIGCHFCTTPASGTRSVFDSTDVPEEPKPKPSPKKVQKTTTFNCKLCNVKLASKVKLKLHVEQKHKGKKIVMKKAGVKENSPIKSSKKDLKEGGEVVAKKLHFERNNRFYCKICMKSFPSARGTVCHITMVHKQKYSVNTDEAPKKGFACGKCKQVFYHRYRLGSHECVAPTPVTSPNRSVCRMKYYYKDDEGQYCCKNCPTIVGSYSGMIKHFNRYHRASMEQSSSQENAVPAKVKKQESSTSKKDSSDTKKENEDGEELELPPRNLFYVRMKRRPQFYACETCTRRFLKTKQLRIHRKKLCKKFHRSHLAPLQPYAMPRANHFVCNFCYKTENEFKFKKIEDVYKHLEVDHNLMVEAQSDLLYVCKHCKVQYKAPAYLRTHIKKVHEKIDTDDAQGSQETEECKDEKPAEADLPSPGRVYPCKICNKKLPLKIALLRHIRLKHTEKPKPSEPVVVKTEPVDPEDLAPEPPVEPENRYECKVCQKSFKLSIALTKHLESHADDQKAPPPAEQTRSETCASAPILTAVSDPQNLTAPLAQPSPSSAPILAAPAQLKCPVCVELFPNKEQLVVHLKSRHAPPPKAAAGQPAKKLTCDLCDKGLVFFSQVGLDQHKRKCHKPS